MSPRFFQPLGGATFAIAMVPAVFAQQVPPPPPSTPVSTEQRDSATLEYLRQQERERILRLQQEQVPDVRLQQPVSADASRYADGDQPCFRIAQVVLAGADAARFDWAQAAVDREDATGKPDPIAVHCVGMAGINLAMRRVQNAILARGYVTTRVLAEPQNIKSGTLRLTVVPGRIRAVRFADGTDGRATAWNAVPTGPGELLNLRDTEQALENFKRVPTAEADIQIARLQSIGTKIC